MKSDYDKLIKEAYEELPEQTKETERFEIPKVKGHLQGTKTIISNFTSIVDTLRREPEHLLKYLQRELATPAKIDGPRLVLGRKLSASLINSKIQQYTESFVLCSECKKPDTQLTKEDRTTILKCTACGAKNPVRAKI
ncbi:translation initiation factor IF-2 subunit beta [archaeon]|nr:translation initiation factor IF-2 subunit beta [archaeon]|tara:strand:- start:12298 stop:12711 length:414 start_codon:yes stop_codon:yes gene_type:complete